MFGHGSHESSLWPAPVVTFSFCQRFSPHSKLTTNLFQKNLIGSAFYIIYSSLRIPLNSIRAGLSQFPQTQFYCNYKKNSRKNKNRKSVIPSYFTEPNPIKKMTKKLQIIHRIRCISASSTSYHCYQTLLLRYSIQQMFHRTFNSRDRNTYKTNSLTLPYHHCLPIRLP